MMLCISLMAVIQVQMVEATYEDCK